MGKSIVEYGKWRDIVHIDTQNNSDVVVVVSVNSLFRVALAGTFGLNTIKVFQSVYVASMSALHWYQVILSQTMSML